MSTAKIDYKITMTGMPEGGSDEILDSILNSSAPGNSKTTVLTTSLGGSTGFLLPEAARCLVLIPASTNTQTVYLSADSGEAGIPLAAKGASIFPITGGTTLFVYSSPEMVGMRRIVW